MEKVEKINAAERYAFYLKYPYRKYCLVITIEYDDYAVTINVQYFDYFLIHPNKYGRVLYNIDKTIIDNICLCQTGMDNDGDWAKLYEWDPDTQSHSDLVGEWK